MGYAVLHLEKAKGADGAMSTHIERTVHPKNADRTRTHLNRELVRFPEGVRNRTQAIAHRIETAGIKRKVAFVSKCFVRKEKCGEVFSHDFAEG